MITRSLLPTLAVGDEVVRVYRGCRDVVPVTKVGRKWVYVRIYNTDWPYGIVTGVSKDGNRGAADRIATVEMLAAEVREAEAVARLNAHGWQPKYTARRCGSTETMEAMADLLDTDAARGPS